MTAPDALEERLRELEASLVLDVATGRGGFAAHLRREYDGLGAIVAVDLSPEVLGRPGTPLRDVDDILAACMDSTRMAFGADTFDLACISNSLHHMTDPRAALEEMTRVLRPGGLLLVTEMYRDGQTETQTTHVMMHDWWAAVDSRCGIHHGRTFTRAGIIEILEGLALTVVLTGDYASLEGDPLDEELSRRLDAAIDTYISRIESAGGDPDLLRTGEELRRRLRTTGFHSATSLALMGRKEG